MSDQKQQKSLCPFKRVVERHQRNDLDAGTLRRLRRGAVHGLPAAG